MNFTSYNKLRNVINESTTKLQRVMNEKLRPALAEEVMKLLKSYSSSPLARYIIRRLHNPDMEDGQTLEIDKVGDLDIYKKDKMLYEALLDVKSGDIGPGEILAGIALGEWTGGEGGDYDIILPDIGKVEVKYLTPFAKSTNVPMGSAAKKRLINTDIPEVNNLVAQVVREKPEILKRYLTEDEMEYFIDETIDQLEGNGNMSTNSIRLVGRILRGAERQGDNSFSDRKVTFDRFKFALENTLHAAMGDAEYIMFIGTKIDDDNKGIGEEVGGKYYIMPKENIRYYHFYRIYDGDRIKIAPFTTEQDFMKSKIYNRG